MTSGLHILGDDDTVLAFGLAGVEGQAVGTPAEARRALAALATEPGAGGRPAVPSGARLLIVTSRVADMIRDGLDAALAEAGMLVVEIPGVGDDLETDAVGRLVARVVGARP